MQIVLGGIAVRRLRAIQTFSPLVRAILAPKFYVVSGASTRGEECETNTEFHGLAEHL
jgi:hypothetical protein